MEVLPGISPAYILSVYLQKRGFTMILFYKFPFVVKQNYLFINSNNRYDITEILLTHETRITVNYFLLKTRY